MMAKSARPPIDLYLEEKAWKIARADLHPVRVKLQPHTRAAIDNASRNSTVLGLYNVRCTEREAGELAEYFAIATLAFRMAGDARGPVCARAAKATRRGFARETKRPGLGAVTGEKLVELRGR